MTGEEIGVLYSLVCFTEIHLAVLNLFLPFVLRLLFVLARGVEYPRVSLP